MSKPLLHFAHSNGIVSACYRKFLAELATDVDVISVPALGLDPRFPIDDNWVSLTEQVRDSIESQAKGRPVIGLGHSLGGMTTYMAAYKYPQLFSGLIMLDPPIVNGLGAVVMGTAKLFGMIDRVTPAGRSLHRRDNWPSREEAYTLLRKKSLFRTFDEDCFNDYLRFGMTDCEKGVCLTMPVQAEVDIFRTTPTNAWRFRERLSMPAAVIAGEQSDFNDAGFVDRLARHHRMPRLSTPGGHMFPLEHPIETARFVKQTLRELKVI